MEFNSKRLFQSSGEEKESRLRSRPRQNVKLGTYTRCSRATAKKCTKKRDARAKLLSC